MKLALQLHRTRISEEMLDTEVLPVIERLGLEFELLPRFHDSNIEVPEGTSMIVVLGGDGTFLAGARLATRHRLPVLGVMVGRLGFLSGVGLAGLEQALKAVVDGTMPVEDRHVLRGRIVSAAGVKFEELAVNDIVAFRHDNDKIRDFKAFHDGDLIANYRADGIILSSAMGSTAYTLAAGGPLVHPSLNVIVLTPICAHSLFTKPLVIPPEDEVAIEPVGDDDPLLVTFDGAHRVVMGAGDRLVVSSHPESLKVYMPEQADFYRVLREKFQHGYLYGEDNA
jgi:NAD+ kinase